MMKFDIGIIGIKHGHFRGHLETLQLMDEIDNIFLVDKDPDLLNQYQKGDKIKDVSTDINSVLSLIAFFIFFTETKPFLSGLI